MTARVIGTAGHVDHGKSTLVKRLTGIDPDRLAEEKAREMTIDLGFAWLTLPDESHVGVVDVPGHRDFIENMLAGVGGIDAALLVIAADEGVMPQTREHLAILDLLGLTRGLIVLTRIDLVDDPDWLLLVEAEIHEQLANTTLQDAEIVPVSAFTGAGISTLIDKITTLLADLPERPDFGQPRLPIDRVFTMSGFGTVVTGTLNGGSLRVGDEVVLLPTELHGRVRGLQSYRQSVQIVYPGSRVAVNLAGIDKSAVSRGFTLTMPGTIQPTNLVDVRFRYLHDAARPLKHNAEVKVFAGTAETIGHVRLLADEVLMPGAESWIQLRLDDPLVLLREDRLILRYPSPPQTIGGGVVVNPHPQRRWRRFQSNVIADLETRMRGTPAQRVAQAAEGGEPITMRAIGALTGYSGTELNEAIQTALDERLLLQLAADLYLATTAYNRLVRTLHQIVTSFHETYPLRLGISREEARNRLGVKNPTFMLLLNAQDTIISDGTLLRHVDHAIRFTQAQEASIVRLGEVIGQAPYTPPSYAEASAITGEDVLRALIELGEVVQVAPDVIFARAAYDEMVEGVLSLIDSGGSMSAKALRDRFQTSRKYAIGLLEYLDSLGITRRVGDERQRGRNAPVSGHNPQ